MPNICPVTTARSITQRSRVSNGRSLFVEGDGRSAWARRYRDICAAHAADLGGDDRLSEAQRSLIRRAATLAVECERAEGAASTGEPLNLVEYTTATNALRRILATFGLERRPLEAVLDLRTYIDQRQEEAR